MKTMDEQIENGNPILRELKRDMDLFLFQRRYQKALNHEVPVEEKIWTAVVKWVTTVRVSWRLFVKRALDIAIASLASVIALPVMALVAVAIKLDSRGLVFVW